MIKRGNAREAVFHDGDDFASFVELIGEAGSRAPMRVVGCCLISKHSEDPLGTESLSPAAVAARGRGSVAVDAVADDLAGPAASSSLRHQR